MIVKKYNEVAEEKVTVEGANGAHIRWLVAEKDGAPNFAMRRFRLEAGGNTPFHAHGWEHEMYVLDGEGVVVTDDGEKPVSAGTFMYVAPGENHSFRNTGAGEMAFLCMIPLVNKQC